MYLIIVDISGAAWHTPVRTCVRWKTEIPKLEKPKKLKNAINIIFKWWSSYKYVYFI